MPYSSCLCTVCHVVLSCFALGRQCSTCGRLTGRTRSAGPFALLTLLASDAPPVSFRLPSLSISLARVLDYHRRTH